MKILTIEGVKRTITSEYFRHQAAVSQGKSKKPQLNHLNKN